MSARSITLILAGSLLLAPLAFAQKSSGGDSKGSSGGSSGSSGSSGSGGSGGYDSGGSYKPSPKGGDSGSKSSYSGGGQPSTAERRHPRPGTGHGGHGRGYAPGGGYYYPGYYNNGPYSPSWGGRYSYWWPYGAYGWYGGYWGYPWGYAGVQHTYVHRPSGSIRVLVDPAEARVYVDGYYAGTVDDFDGLFQRLNVSPGRHEIALKLEGYKTHRLKVYVGPNRTFKLHYDMVRGAGETFADLAGRAPEREVRSEPEATEAEDADLEEDDAEDVDETAGGKLRLRVSPADASVYVDGAFRGTAREAASLRLSAGRHRIELVRPGYRTDERDVEILSDETTTVTIAMEKPSI